MPCNIQHDAKSSRCLAVMHSTQDNIAPVSRPTAGHRWRQEGYPVLNARARTKAFSKAPSKPQGNGGNGGKIELPNMMLGWQGIFCKVNGSQTYLPPGEGIMDAWSLILYAPYLSIEQASLIESLFGCFLVKREFLLPEQLMWLAAYTLQSGIEGGGSNTRGAGKSLKLNSWGVTMNGGLIKCPRNTATYILVNRLKVFSSSSLNNTIIGTTFSYIVSALDGSFSLFMHSSSNANSKSGLNDVILDQN